jgi:hypothetical protein
MTARLVWARVPLLPTSLFGRDSQEFWSSPSSDHRKMPRLLVWALAIFLNLSCFLQQSGREQNGIATRLDATPGDTLIVDSTFGNVVQQYARTLSILGRFEEGYGTNDGITTRNQAHGSTRGCEAYSIVRELCLVLKEMSRRGRCSRPLFQ